MYVGLESIRSGARYAATCDPTQGESRAVIDLIIETIPSADHGKSGRYLVCITLLARFLCPQYCSALTRVLLNNCTAEMLGRPLMDQEMYRVAHGNGRALGPPVLWVLCLAWDPMFISLPNLIPGPLTPRINLNTFE